MGKPRSIASPRSAKLARDGANGPSARSMRLDFQNNLLWQERVAGTARQERFIFSQFE